MHKLDYNGNTTRDNAYKMAHTKQSKFPAQFPSAGVGNGGVRLHYKSVFRDAHSQSNVKDKRRTLTKSSSNESTLTPKDLCLSPKTAHIAFKWGSCSRNWILLNIWHYELMLHPIFKLTPNSEEVIKCRRNELREDLNRFLDMTHSDEDLKLESQDFVVLRLTGQTFEERMLPFSGRLELFAQQFQFYSSEGKYRAVLSKHVVRIIACGSLAEILVATSKSGDIFIISGGYSTSVNDEDPGTVSFILNFNRNELTKLYRLHCPIKNILMLEKVLPLQQEKCFQFTYKVVRGKLRREVVQTRLFIYQNLCPNVRDTMAYERVRWDFPMPIVYDANPYETFDLLINPKLSMFHEGTPSKKTSRFFRNEKEDLHEEDLYYTPSNFPTRNSADKSKNLNEQNSMLDSTVFFSCFKEKLSYDYEETDSDDKNDELIESDQEDHDRSTSFESFSSTSTNPLNRRYNVGSTTRKSRKRVQPELNMSGAICNCFVWFVALALFLFVILTIAIIWSNIKTDSCSSENHSSLPPTSSYESHSTSKSAPLFNQVPPEATENVWLRVKDWVGFIFHWIDEKCGLHCFLKKAGWI